MNKPTGFILLLIALVVLACSTDETCRESTKVNLQIGFYGRGTTTPLTIDSISVISIPGDSVFYENKKRISKIELPLNAHSTVTRFAIRFNEKWDTLTVLYATEPWFVSYACGMIYTHQIDTALITNHVSQSLLIPGKLINTANAQHIQLYQ